MVAEMVGCWGPSRVVLMDAGLGEPTVMRMAETWDGLWVAGTAA